jgi:hypothetical protein
VKAAEERRGRVTLDARWLSGKRLPAAPRTQTPGRLFLEYNDGFKHGARAGGRRTDTCGIPRKAKRKSPPQTAARLRTRTASALVDRSLAFSSEDSRTIRSSARCSPPERFPF